MWANGNQEKTFVFNSLKNSGSKDLKNICFTIESTSNPAWLCVQSLPYVKQMDCENATNIADAIFANSLARKIVVDNPKIKAVYDKWKLNSDKSMKSPLSKNQDLKNMLIEETPWVVDAMNEEENIRNIQLLFDENNTKNDLEVLTNKLMGLQNPDGGFSWFKGGKSNRYISQYILEIFGRLKKLNAFPDSPVIESMIKLAWEYTNYKAIEDYNRLVELAKKGKIKLEDDHLDHINIHFLYISPLYDNVQASDDLNKVKSYYLSQSKKYWAGKALYMKGLISFVLRANGDNVLANQILKALDEQSIYNEELGRYSKENSGYNWWQLNIETHATLIEAFHANKDYNNLVNELRIWLIKNKQTQQWKNSKASVAAIYSLLLDNSGILNDSKPVNIYIDNKNISNEINSTDIEAGTGYYKKKWSGNEVSAEMSDIKIENPNKSIVWGAAHWQYLQDMDKIESFKETPLKISRELYLVEKTDKGEVLKEIQGSLSAGDIVRVKVKVEVDRPMDFVMISDQRAACFEPTEQISKYTWQGGLGYYQNPKDSKTNFFIDYLPRGSYIFEYSLFVTQSGNFSNGIADIQSYYAPEFNSHSAGGNVKVKS